MTKGGVSRPCRIHQFEPPMLDESMLMPMPPPKSWLKDVPLSP